MIRQSAINLIGGLFPAVIALACTPLILDHHGGEFFGIYSIQTAMLLTIGLMDLGISRGILLTTYDRELNPSGDPAVPLKAGMRLTRQVAAVVFIAMIVLLAIVSWQRPTSADVRMSTLIHLVSGVLTIMTLPLRALLEIRGKFATLNLIRSILASTVPLAPLLPQFDSEAPLAAAAVYVLVARVLGLWAYLSVCRFGALKLDLVTYPSGTWRNSFIRRCGWVGLTNAGSMALTYGDRFLLAGLTSSVVVANYVIAHELATKVWMATGAIMSAAMPRVGAELLDMRGPDAGGTPRSMSRLKGLIMVAVVMPSIALILLLAPVLDAWLGSGYDREVLVVGKILLAGVALNSMSTLNFGLLQLHRGESDGAWLQLVNIIMAAVFLALLVPPFGASGAALAFALRLSFDAFITRALLRRRSASQQGFSHLELLAVAAALACAALLFPGRSPGVWGG